MRKLYNEFFCIQKNEKIREKVMLTRVATTVIIMIVCLAAMSITAYAYFSHNVTSGSNTIKAATFETKVSIIITDSNGKAVENTQITPITSDYKKYRIEGLEVGKCYTVTITPTEHCTAKTGFVIVTADNCPDTYHTQQLATDVNAKGGQTTSLSFKLMVTGTTKVHLLAHWGTSSYYDAYKDKGDKERLYITQGEEIKMNINVKDTNESGGDNGNNGTGETTSTTDTTTTPPVTEKPTPPSTETTKPADTTTSAPTETSEPTSTAEPSTSPPEPDATQPAETTQTTETTGPETTEQTEPTPSTPENTGTTTIEESE